MADYFHSILGQLNFFLSGILYNAFSDDSIANSDHMFNFIRLIKRKKEIAEKDVIVDSDSFVVLPGIVGSGKTTFMDSYVLGWSQGRLLAQVKLLLYIRCRDMANISVTERY